MLSLISFLFCWWLWKCACVCVYLLLIFILFHILGLNGDWNCLVDWMNGLVDWQYDKPTADFNDGMDGNLFLIYSHVIERVSAWQWEGGRVHTEMFCKCSIRHRGARIAQWLERRKQEWLLVFYNKIRTHKTFKITLFIRTKHNMRMFRVIPIITEATKRHLNNN